MTTTSELLTTAEVARAVGIHRNIVTADVARGRLTPERKLPGRTGAYLFTRAAVDAYAETRSTRR